MKNKKSKKIKDIKYESYLQLTNISFKALEFKFTITKEVNQHKKDKEDTRISKSNDKSLLLRLVDIIDIIHTNLIIE